MKREYPDKDFQTVATEYGRRYLISIRADLDAYKAAEGTDREDATRENIEESPLAVQVREGWHTAGEAGEIEEYFILLGTGGPAARIVGELDGFKQPSSAHFEYQDWGKPWTKALLSGEEEDTLLEYARFFYFGE